MTNTIARKPVVITCVELYSLTITASDKIKLPVIQRKKRFT